MDASDASVSPQATPRTGPPRITGPKSDYGDLLVVDPQHYAIADELEQTEPDFARVAELSSEIRAALDRFEALLAQLLEAFAREARVRALGTALERASRQLHTLEQRVAPELEAQIATTTRALDERDREDQTRLRTLRQKSRKPTAR